LSKEGGQKRKGVEILKSKQNQIKIDEMDGSITVSAKRQWPRNLQIMLQ
jgi:hypothetical protein